ncbi:MAG: DOMON-like domain-containing protein [Betaproteobacteria bacterium]|nr:DOMON-like domain-containing protein [Betaproteobacteria bacterium]
MPLVCHPGTPAPAVHAIEADALRGEGGGLSFRFRLFGDLERLSVPPAAGGDRVDGLWRHCCFEAFVGVPDETAYLEFNFSPSGQWAAYAFSDYRRRDFSADPVGAPKIAVGRSAGGLALDALVSCADLPAAARTGACPVGLSAVVETPDGRLSYWALHHPGGDPARAPDFHVRETFVLELPALPKTR